MPLSPPFRPTASNPHSISPPIPAGPLPTLPFEIVRRIIHFRLSLSSASYPPKLGEEPEAGWDDWSGIRGRLRASKRVEERRDVTRTARGLMGVCKAWKPVVMKYLYSSPYLTENLPLLASSLVAGDSKWSDINLHQFSIPGRYITMLDLSTVSSSSSSSSSLSFSQSSLHPLEFRRAVMKILPLLPNVVHLKLPAGELPFPLEEIGWAPFAKNLKCLEGVEVDCNILDSGEDALIALLRKTPNMEVLSVVGSGANSSPHDPSTILSVGVPVSPRNETKLSLPKLHTLRLEDVRSSNLLSALIEAELPSLERLALTSFFGVSGDQTYLLQEAHGSKVRSLTYLQSTQRSRLDAGAANVHGHGHGQANGNGGIDFGLMGMGHGLIPASETLSLHPNLQHLAFLVPDYQQLETVLSTAPIHHPLKWLTIFKWVEASASTNSADDAQVDGNANDNINGIIGSVQAGGGGSRDTSQFLRKILLDRQISNNGHPTHHVHARSPDLSAIPPTTPGSYNPPNDTTQMHNHLNLRRVNIDGFKWVKPELGRFALETGTSGEMRKLALVLYRDGNGLELGDMDGNLAPFLGLTGGTGAGCGGGAGVGYAAIGGGMTLAGGPIDRTKGRRRSSGAGSLAGMVGMMSVSQGGSGLGQGGSSRSKGGGDDEDGG